MSNKDSRFSYLRENMILNATNFLLHPNVIDSSQQRKIAFLKGKGMTPEEIKEAFRRIQGKKSVCCLLCFGYAST